MSKYENLGYAIEHSVRKYSEGKSVGVSFSGGMDSGLVAALASKYAKSVTCYTCGTDDSFDVAAGKELAEKLNLPWVQCRITEENIEETIKEMMLATKVSDPLTISYDLQLFTVCKTASEKIILTGQGSDEYFGGCFRSVTDSDEEYESFCEWGIERLRKVSIPCETTIAKHFGKKLFYPFLDEKVLDCIQKIEPQELRPHSLEERKSVLKKAVKTLELDVLTTRTKKASQYGSNTTELIRNEARKKGVRYNRYISDIYESLGLRNANLLRDSVLDVRIDPILKYDAESVLDELGITDSEAVALFYKKLAKDGNIDFLK